VRDLRVLGVTADGEHVLLGAGAGRPSHRLAVDERLRAAIRGELGPPGESAAESALTPREIQARLRAGGSPEEIARAAGVPVTRVLRYAGPVLSERERVLDEAWAARMARARRGLSARPLGEAVATHLGAVSGLRAETIQWRAWRRDDSRWVVEVSYISRARRRHVEWLWHPVERHLEPLDATATSLGYVDERTTAVRPAASEPVRRRKATGRPKRVPAGKAAKPTPGRKPRTAVPPPPKSVGRTRAPRKAAAPAVPRTRAPRKAAAPAVTRTRAPRKAAAPAVTRTRKAAAPAVTRTRAPRKAAAPAVTRTRKAGAAKSPPRTVTAVKAPAREPVGAVAAAPVPATLPRARPGPGATGGRKGRATVPSWADVLLGGPAATTQGTARQRAGRGS